jgi:hypothetical protein
LAAARPTERGRGPAGALAAHAVADAALVGELDVDAHRDDAARHRARGLVDAEQRAQPLERRGAVDLREAGRSS